MQPGPPGQVLGHVPLCSMQARMAGRMTAMPMPRTVFQGYAQQLGLNMAQYKL